MDYSQIPLLLTVALGLGLLHSLDADHIMAVSNLASGQLSIKTNIRFCLRWALGHGLAIFMVGLLVFALGIHLPEQVSLYAERFVAAILILLGLYVLYDIFLRRIHIHFHQHDDLPEHAHWHSHVKQSSHQHSHAAIFVGILHGLAGSAPLLALIPITMTQHPAIGFLYLMIFSLGVVLSMLMFGGALGFISKHVARYGDKVFKIMRAFLGVGAMVMGSVIFLRTVS